MGKKNKKEKGRGAEKQAQKLMKKANKKGGGGEDMSDLEAMIAEFKHADKLKTCYHEEKCEKPSPRTNLTVCAHPERDELILFGGEYFDGKKTHMYNELFVYNTKRCDWLKRFVPNPPPPRSAHQAVTVARDGGQMWVFGGEFSSPNNAKFHHYKDLWVLLMKEQRWEQVKAQNPPSPRSGHRMCHFRKSLFVFGGFHESSREFVYFNDCYTFDLADLLWTRITPAAGSILPTPRSACQLAVAPTGILVVGGYSKVRVKKDVEKGTQHSDVYLISQENNKWKWRQVKESGQKPWPRSSYSLAQISAQRSVMFGGVRDEDKEENIESQFFNSMSCLDVISHRWFNFDLRKGIKDEDSDNSDEAMDHDGASASVMTDHQVPCPRINACVAVKKHIMYVYGGYAEQGNKQITLNDLWSIDVKKVDQWKELVKSDAVWQIEDSDAESSGDDEDDDDASDDEAARGECSTSKKKIVDIEWDGVELPQLRSGDSLPSYWFRTREEWLELVSGKLCEMDGDDDEEMRADQVAARAEAEARKHFAKQQQTNVDDS